MTTASTASSQVNDYHRPFASERTPVWVIWAGVVMGCLMAALSLFRHWHYLSHSFDLGFYVQDVWAIGEGIWRNTVGGFHVFDDHFSPVLVLLAPLGGGSAAEAMLVVQARQAYSHSASVGSR